MPKKLVCVVLTLMCFFAWGSPVWAEGVTLSEDKDTSQNIGPLYQYISSVRADLEITSNGRSLSTGNLIHFQNYDSVITITLQQSTNGSSWSNHKTWSKSFSGSGSHNLEEVWYVPKGYYYRVVNTSEVKNGNTVLETASHTSERIYY
jgi:hypothetical protein